MPNCFLMVANRIFKLLYRNLFLKISLVVCFTISTFKTFATTKEIRYGFQIIYSVGSHLDRIGLTGFIFNNNQVQLGLQWSCYYNLKALGPNQKYAEYNLNYFINYGFVKCKNQQPIIGALAAKYHINAAYRYNIGYSYQWFINQIGTTQVVGAIHAKMNRTVIIISNDLLAKAYLDRFRTGAIGVYYMYRHNMIGLSNVLWTGEWAQQVYSTLYPSRHGYRIMKPNGFGNFSHGILQLSIDKEIFPGQVGQAKIGIDAEPIRHFVQNKLLHDFILLPKKWTNKNNAHIPMIANDGTAYLFLKGQKVKKPKGLIQLGNEGILFY